MEPEQTTTEETLAGDQGSPSSDGSSAGNSSISLEEMSTILGKEFKDKDTALKSVKDTYNYVGKAGELNSSMKKLTTELGMDEDRVLSTLKSMSDNPTPAPTSEGQATPVDPDGFVSKDQYDTDMFYSQRSELVPYRDVIGALAAKDGKPLAEVVESDAFKNIYAKVSGFDEIQSKKSVLESNPRLSSASDKLSESKEALSAASKAAQAGDMYAAEASSKLAKRSAVDAVKEAYNMN